MRNLVIYQDIINKFYFDDAGIRMLLLAKGIDVKTYIETCKKIYGLIQISCFTKHSLYKITVNISKGTLIYFSCYYGTKLLCKASNYQSALKFMYELKSKNSGV